MTTATIRPVAREGGMVTRGEWVLLCGIFGGVFVLCCASAFAASASAMIGAGGVGAVVGLALGFWHTR